MRLIFTLFNHPMLFALAASLPFLAVLIPARAGESSNDTLRSTSSYGSNVWSDIRQFGVEGRGWNDTKDFYDRLPAKA